MQDADVQTPSLPASRDELRFFGQVNASISHEIKNVLAVINEGAGLLDDLCMLAAKGRPFDPEKLVLVAQSILGQVKRGDTIVRRMNAFAHSVDREVHRFSLPEVVRLMAGLGERVAAGKELGLDVEDGEDVVVETDLYALEHLLHAMLRFAIDHAHGAGRLCFSISRAEEGLEIHLRGLHLPEGVQLPGELTTLAENVGMRLKYAARDGRLVVLVPADMVRA